MASERLRLAEQEAAARATQGAEDLRLQLEPRRLGEYVVPPQHTIARGALADYIALMREFGVGPASASRVRPAKKRQDRDAFGEVFPEA